MPELEGMLNKMVNIDFCYYHYRKERNFKFKIVKNICPAYKCYSFSQDQGRKLTQSQFQYYAHTVLHSSIPAYPQIIYKRGNRDVEKQSDLSQITKLIKVVPKL